jgi:hypothetical protein
MARRDVHYRLPADLIEAARAKAAADGVTVTEVIESCLTGWVGGDGLEAVRRWRRTPEQQRLLDQMQAHPEMGRRLGA